MVFDDKGVCHACRQHEFKQVKIDWTTKKQELDELIEPYRGKGDYYCLVPSSGGQDSTWNLSCLVKRYSMKPLVVPPEYGYEQIECHAPERARVH